jgi:alpha-ribazole phosphatase/probable phosphoglycerate mutase
MVTTLYLIRHGETEGDGIKRYKGSIDVPLSEGGIEQMKQVARYLNMTHKTYGLRAVYCSPLIRATLSAEIIAEPHGLKPIVIHDLRERSFGIWEGMSFNEIKEKYPEEFEAWAGNPLKYSPMGGESTLDVRDRVITALDNILTNHNEETIAIVAHGGVNRIILCHVMGIPLENIFRIEQDFGAVNIIEFHDKYPVVKLLNGVLCG